MDISNTEWCPDRIKVHEVRVKFHLRPQVKYGSPYTQFHETHKSSRHSVELYYTGFHQNRPKKYENYGWKCMYAPKQSMTVNEPIVQEYKKYNRQLYCTELLGQISWKSDCLIADTRSQTDIRTDRQMGFHIGSYFLFREHLRNILAAKSLVSSEFTSELLWDWTCTTTNVVIRVANWVWWRSGNKASLDPLWDCSTRPSHKQFAITVPYSTLHRISIYRAQHQNNSRCSQSIGK